MLQQEILDLIGPDLRRVEDAIAREVGSPLQIITDVGRYLQESGGKRLRPALHLLAVKLCERPIDAPVIQTAAILELLHTAALVHDDIIDGAETRRGSASVHSRWGTTISVLIGDWLYMHAFELALQQRRLRILDIITETCREMTEGELLEETNSGRLEVTEEEYLRCIRGKTAHLFCAATELGGVLSDVSKEKQAALRCFGLNLGIAFQMSDDILDFTAEEQKLGKPVGQDLCEGKITLPILFLLSADRQEHVEMIRTVLRDGGYQTVARRQVMAALEREGAFERARRTAREYAAAAAKDLDRFPPSPEKEILTGVCELVVTRSA